MGIKRILNGREEWLEARETVVTATEASAVFGLNPYMSAAKMLEKKLQPEFFDNNYAMVGRLLEPVVVEATNHFLGTNFKLFDEGDHKVFYKHSDLRLGATPDAHMDETVIVECKTTNPKKFLEWQSGRVPNNYVIQVFAQMMCMEVEEAYISGMSTDLSPTFTGWTFPIAIYKVNINDRVKELISKEINRFWQCVYDGKTFSYSRKANSEMKKLILENVERIL